MWLNWESQHYPEDKQRLTHMRDNWKASPVRAAMGVSTTDTRDSDYLSAQEAAKAQVNKVVQNSIDPGMCALSDWHEVQGNSHLEQSKAFFTEMASKWGS